jgi:hypothetical protein
MYLRLLAFFMILSVAGFSQPKLEGRWDLTVDRGDQKEVPSWLEVKHSGINMLVGYFVAPDGGSARPVARVNTNGAGFSFAIPPQWEAGKNDLTVEGQWTGDKMTGTMIMPDGKKYSFTGNRAPSLEQSGTVSWGAPIKLLNGKNTEGWHASGAKNQWVVENGVLKSPASGSNLITDQKFTDFKLHIEFKYPPHSNSGVYLRGRYEVQVEDGLEEPSNVGIGGIYGYIIPNQRFTKGPGEWQVYDITIIGRRVTVVANGKTIICDQVIPGITGGALDSKEDEPGPIMLQGDHGPIEYRNIVITPRKQ